MINKSRTLFSFVVVSLLGASGLAEAVQESPPSITVHIGTAPANLIDTAKAAFYVVETATPGGGAYTIFNNTTDYQLHAFGVTNPNPDSVAVINGIADQGVVAYHDEYGGLPDEDNQHFWKPLNLGASNWNESDLLWNHVDSAPSTALALFGDANSVLGADGYANYFEATDAGPLLGGWSASRFGFINALPASSLFGVASGPNGQLMTFYAAPAVPVPEPETYAMLLAGLGLIGAVTRRRKQLLA